MLIVFFNVGKMNKHFLIEKEKEREKEINIKTEIKFIYKNEKREE